MQRSLEVSIADIEHRQHAQQPYLAEGHHGAFRQSTGFCSTLHALHRFARASASTKRRGSLEMHFLGSATRVIIQSGYCVFRPAIAFRKQRHSQEDRGGSCGKSSTDREITAGAEAPFQSRANVIDVRKGRRSSSPTRSRCFQAVPQYVFGMPERRTPATRRSRPVSTAHRPASSQAAGNDHRLP